MHRLQVSGFPQRKWKMDRLPLSHRIAALSQTGCPFQILKMNCNLRVKAPHIMKTNGSLEIQAVPPPVRLVTAAPISRRCTSERLAREWKTISAMVRCYCQGHHDPASALCPDCQQLLDYAGLRLERCRFGSGKPACAKCPVHCYQPARREQVKAVMRYAGPRMLWQHPILCVRHWLDGLRKAPAIY